MLECRFGLGGMCFRQITATRLCESWHQARHHTVPPPLTARHHTVPSPLTARHLTVTPPLTALGPPVRENRASDRSAYTRRPRFEFQSVPRNSAARVSPVVTT